MKTGRPRKAPEDRLVPAPLRVPAGLLESIDRRALRERKTTAEVIREILAREFPYLKTTDRGQLA